jgi:hypothetical protein
MQSKKFSFQDTTSDLEGKEKMPRRARSPAKIVGIFLISVVAVLVILSIPFVQQTQIHIIVDSKSIVHAWVDTPKVSLLSTVITPIPEVGSYSILINVTETNENFTFRNVQPNKYVAIWRSNGIPTPGIYNIEIKLLNQTFLIDTYAIQATF